MRLMTFQATFQLLFIRGHEAHEYNMPRDHICLV